MTTVTEMRAARAGVLIKLADVRSKGGWPRLSLADFFEIECALDNSADGVFESFPDDVFCVVLNNLDNVGRRLDALSGLLAGGEDASAADTLSAETS